MNDTMADSPSNSFNKTHLQDPNAYSFSAIPTKHSMSKFHYFFSKSLIIVLVLLVFSFFPSQVPEVFKKTTVINKIWDLIYLLVIGIAVCYGLFSRKIDRVHSSDDDICDKESYLSGISHISSIFDDGIQNTYGFDEKYLFERSEFGNCDGKKIDLNQCFLGESLIVIDDEKYVLEQLGKPKTIKQNCPSKSLDSAAESGKSVVEGFSNGGDGMKSKKFRGLVPIKLEGRFIGSDSSSDYITPLIWHSKSMRLEKREDICCNEGNEASLFMPHCVGVLGYESIRSKSLRFSLPAQMKISSEKEEPKSMETDHYRRNCKTSFPESKISIGTSSKTKNNSSSKEFPKDLINVEDSKHGTGKETIKNFGRIKAEQSAFNPNIKSKHKQFSIHASSKTNLETAEFSIGTSSMMKIPTEKEEPKDMETDNSRWNGKPSFVEAKTREFSIGSSSKMNNHLSSKEVQKDFSKIKDKDSNHGTYKESMKDFSKIKIEQSAFDRNLEPKHQRFSISLSSETNLENSKPMLGKLESSNSTLKPAPTYKRGKSVRTNRPKEQVLEPKVKADDMVETGSKPIANAARDVNVDETIIINDELSDTEPHSGEVDRKADEFIAKFREQIRLQQVASARRLNLW